jgi:hypothetical protein
VHQGIEGHAVGNGVITIKSVPLDVGSFHRKVGSTQGRLKTCQGTPVLIGSQNVTSEVGIAPPALHKRDVLVSVAPVGGDTEADSFKDAPVKGLGEVGVQETHGGLLQQA